jgi:hypothetical protein
MTMKHLLLAAPAALLVLGGAANAGQTINKVGVLVCVTDKWNEKEVEKDHKLVDYAGRCVNVPDEPADTPLASEDCIGNYEYMPDGSWKGAGTCELTFKGGDKLTETWEEGSHLKQSLFKITGGTGKYAGAVGGGTYAYEPLTDTLSGGRYDGKIELP